MAPGRFIEDHDLTNLHQRMHIANNGPPTVLTYKPRGRGGYSGNSDSGWGARGRGGGDMPGYTGRGRGMSDRGRGGGDRGRGIGERGRGRGSSDFRGGSSYTTSDSSREEWRREAPSGPR